MTDPDFIEIHIDETGDRGMKKGSSDHFCLAAFAFRHSHYPVVRDHLHALKSVLWDDNSVARPLHAVDHLKDHERLIGAARALAAVPNVRVFYVVLPKRELPPGSAMASRFELMYTFPARLLIERMSSFARSIGLPAQPTFAAVKGLPRSTLDTYIDHLRTQRTEIDWNYLRVPAKVEHAANRDGLQWADVAGAALHRALRPKGVFGQVEPAYLMELAPVIWAKQPVSKYGLKCVSHSHLDGLPWWPSFEQQMKRRKQA